MENKKGFAPILVVALVVVVIAGVAGYIFMSNKGGSALPKVNIPGVKTALDSKCKFNDAELCKYINKGMAQDMSKLNYTIKTASTDSEGKKSNSEMKMDNKGNTQIVSSEKGKETSNIIVMGNITYMKDFTDNKWFKMENESEDGQEMGDMPNMESIKEEFEKQQENIEYKKIGKEACGTLTCFKYQIIDPTLTDTTQYIYFDDREYLMRKMKTEDQSGYSYEMIFEYGPVTITAPSPVKEMPSYDSDVMDGSVKGVRTPEGNMPSVQPFFERAEDVRTPEGNIPSEEELKQLKNLMAE